MEGETLERYDGPCVSLRRFTSEIQVGRNLALVLVPLCLDSHGPA